MRKFLIAMLAMMPCAVNAENVVYGQSSAGPQPLGVNSSGQVSTTLLSGEDTTNSVFKVEGQFSYKNIPHADTQVKASAGFIHAITCNSSDAAATAGSIAILDSTAAGAGTTILIYNILAANYLPWTSILDVVTTTGIYIDYTTTGDVDCVVSYR